MKGDAPAQGVGSLDLGPAHKLPAAFAQRLEDRCIGQFWRNLEYDGGTFGVGCRLIVVRRFYSLTCTIKAITAEMKHGHSQVSAGCGLLGRRFDPDRALYPFKGQSDGEY
jgi:hypothetical protein